MRVAAVIPCRYGSTRFPGKPLAEIAGMTMVERVYRQVVQAACFSEIVVATDDRRIFEEVTRFGGKAEMTDNTINSGTERVWAVVKEKSFDAAVNVQGDEPLIPPDLIRTVAMTLKKAPIVSAARRSGSYEDFCSTNVVKVVCDNWGRALYFSRSPIPYSEKSSFAGFFQHIGIYGYRREQLEGFVHEGSSELERSENLEQLRFLLSGHEIRIIETDYVSHGVDTPHDIEKIEKQLRS